MHISYITNENGQTLKKLLTGTEHKLSVYESIEKLFEASKYIRTDILIVRLEECITKEYLFQETCKKLPSAIVLFTGKIPNPAAGLITINQWDFIEEPIKPEVMIQILKNYNLVKQEKQIFIKTIPNFSIYQNGQELKISGNKTVELLALLADSNGNLVHKNQILKAIWHEGVNLSILRNTASKLNKELEKYGIKNFVKRQGEYRYLDKTMFNSDLNNILEKLQGLENYNNKYLEEYSEWNSYTKNILKNLKENFST